jgi:hypothetical protein
LNEYDITITDGHNVRGYSASQYKIVQVDGRPKVAELNLYLVRTSLRPSLMTVRRERMLTVISRTGSKSSGGDPEVEMGLSLSMIIHV